MAYRNCQAKVAQAIVRLPANNVSRDDFAIFSDRNLMGWRPLLSLQALPVFFFFKK